MIIDKIVLNEEKVSNLIDNINNLCIKCEYIGKMCSLCSVDEAKNLFPKLNINPDLVSKLKNYRVLIGEIDNYEGEIEFNKNNVLLTQNSIEEICEKCEFIGNYCMDCNIHQIRRLIASLPLKEIELFNPIKEKKSSGATCGTSCSTGCSTKKK